jgi:hypothetical protein
LILEMNEVVPEAVKEAERCRREASEMITKNPDQYASLVGQPSGWCVVTEKGFWKRSFHGHHEESLLRERIQHGHKVILTVGIVADPRVSVTSQNHVATVHVSDECKLPGEKLAVLTAHAKLHAASAMFR